MRPTVCSARLDSWFSERSVQFEPHNRWQVIFVAHDAPDVIAIGLEHRCPRRHGDASEETAGRREDFVDSWCSIVAWRWAFLGLRWHFVGWNALRRRRNTRQDVAVSCDINSLLRLLGYVMFAACQRPGT